MSSPEFDLPSRLGQNRNQVLQESSQVPSPGPNLKRSAWGFADQGVSSLSNFCLTIIVARGSTATQFGVFALLISSYLLLNGLSQSASSEPLVVRFSSATRESTMRQSRHASGFALSMGLVGATACVIFAVLDSQYWLALLAFGLSLPGLLLQDSLRFVSAAIGSPRIGFESDLLWTLLQFPFLVCLLIGGVSDVWAYLLCWGATGTLAGVYAMIRLSVVPSLRQCWAWVHEQRDLSGRFSLEYGASQGVYLLLVYMCAAIAGVAAAGSLRAVQTIFGPLNLVFLGARLSLLPELIRVHQHEPGRLRTYVFRLSVLFATASAGYLIVAYFCLRWFGATIFGATYALAAPLIVLVGSERVLAGFSNGAFAGLRALAQARKSLRVRIVTGAAMAAFGSVGAVWDGARGVALSLLLLSPLSAVLWWREFRRADVLDQDVTRDSLG